MMPQKVTVEDVLKTRKEGRKLVMVTAYDYTSALLADNAGIDIILVGDSGGMVMLGYKDTVPVTMDEMIFFCKAVVRGADRPLLVADMPFMSYHVSTKEAIHNAGRLVKEGGVQAVKLEGGSEIVDTVRAIVNAGIPVMGHIGLTPQSASLRTGYKVQGKTREDGLKFLKDALSLQEAGVFSVVLESLTTEVAKVVTNRLDIPTIGIGAGIHCDGQVLVFHDLLGLYDRISPKFVKRYQNLAKSIKEALEAYASDVRSSSFPSEEHSYHMFKEEAEEFLKEVDRIA